ncbi:MAG TPA: LirA/MavJ family T4SS effector [Paracoccaceae bacterium]|nr:LirA/MavJ family T4SS effector [Paracoccaceae bacterium]
MVAVTPAAVAREIVERCGKGVADDPMLADFAAIGALMTDGPLCLRHLRQLNDALFARCERDPKIFNTLFTVRKGGLFGKDRTVLKPHPHERYGGSKGFVVHKHHKLLTSVLDEHEAKSGFNTGRIPVDLPADAPGPDEREMPARTPTLSRFVYGDDFRKYLFQYAYHWKDTGVGASHGEFTHRLQWYVIVEHAAASGFLKHRPLELFAACALRRWRFEDGSQSGVWDLIVDKNGDKEETFRRPEFLHGFLVAAADRKHEDHGWLWLLAQLVRGRSNKRRIDAGRREQEGKSSGEIDVPEDAERRGVMFVRNPETGRFDETEGSIFWKAKG